MLEQHRANHTSYIYIKSQITSQKGLKIATRGINQLFFKSKPDFLYMILKTEPIKN
jgi:hypothetical protein